MNFDKIERLPSDVALSATSALKLNGARQLHSTLASNADLLQGARKHATRLDGSSPALGSPNMQTSTNDIPLTPLDGHPGSNDEISDLMLEESPLESTGMTHWMKRNWKKVFAKPAKDTGLAVFLGLVPCVGPVICFVIAMKTVYVPLDQLEVNPEDKLDLQRRVLKHMARDLARGIMVPILGSLYNRILQRNLHVVELAEQYVNRYTQQSQKNYSEFCNQLGGSITVLPTAPFQALDSHLQLESGVNSGSGSAPGSRLSEAEKVKADYYQRQHELERQQMQQQQMHAQGPGSQNDVIAQGDDEFQVLGHDQSHSVGHGLGHGFGQAQGYIPVLCQGFGYVNEQGHSEGPVQSYHHDQQAYGQVYTSNYNQYQIRHADVYDQGHATANSHGQVSNYLQVPQHSRISQHYPIPRYSQVLRHPQTPQHGQVPYYGQDLQHSHDVRDSRLPDMLPMYASTGYYQATDGHQPDAASAVDTHRTNEQPAASAILPSVVPLGINASANYGGALRRRNGFRASHFPARLPRSRSISCHQGPGGYQPAVANTSYDHHVPYRPVATAMTSSVAFANMNADAKAPDADEILTTNDQLDTNDDVIARIQSWQASIPLHPPLLVAPPIPFRPLPSIVHANASATIIRVLTPVEHHSVDQETIQHHGHVSDNGQFSRNQPLISDDPTTLQETNVPGAGTPVTPIEYHEQRAGASTSNTANLVACLSGAQNPTPNPSCQAGPSDEVMHSINQSGASDIQSERIIFVEYKHPGCSSRSLSPSRFATAGRNEYDSENESEFGTRMYQHTDSGESFDDPELLRVPTGHEHQQLNENGSSSSNSSSSSDQHRQERRIPSLDSHLGRYPAHGGLRVTNPDPSTPSMGPSALENGSRQSLASGTAVTDADNEQACQAPLQVPTLIITPTTHQSGSSLPTNTFTSTTGSAVLHHQQPQAGPNVYGTTNKVPTTNSAHVPRADSGPIYSAMCTTTNINPNLPLLPQSRHYLQVPQERHAGISSHRKVTNHGLQEIEYNSLTTAWYGLDPRFVSGHNYNGVMHSGGYNAAPTAPQLPIPVSSRTQVSLFDDLGGADGMNGMLGIIQQERSRVNRIRQEEQAAQERVISHVDFPDPHAQPLPIVHDQHFGLAAMNPPQIPPRTSSLFATANPTQQVDQERPLLYVDSPDPHVRPLPTDHLQRFGFAHMNPLQLLPRVQLRGVNSPMDRDQALTAISSAPLQITTTRPARHVQGSTVRGIGGTNLSTNPQLPMLQASGQYRGEDALRLPSRPLTEYNSSDEYNFGEDKEVPEEEGGKDKDDGEDGEDEDDEYDNGGDYEEIDEDYGYQGDSERDVDEGVVRGPDLDDNLPLTLPLPIDHLASTRPPVSGRPWHEEPNYCQRWYGGRDQRVDDRPVEVTHVDINSNNVDTAGGSKAELDDVSVHGDDAFEAFSLARTYQTPGAELVFSGRINGSVQRPDICEVDRLDLRQAIEDAGLPSNDQGGGSPLEESSRSKE
ncbi:hypothetical protein BG011_006610 [Mortierella polycephala]|uniref:Uncharacterized protein n=1 Tax=Mortierella polycephala TaxID=41804 RepID=A0A9P6PUT9_9FUNG|nr:hypothetical protein BG011_006610 [Mortierella polycephala]